MPDRLSEGVDHAGVLERGLAAALARHDGGGVLPPHHLHSSPDDVKRVGDSLPDSAGGGAAGKPDGHAQLIVVSQPIQVSLDDPVLQGLVNGKIETYVWNLQGEEPTPRIRGNSAEETGLKGQGFHFCLLTVKYIPGSSRLSG